MATPFNQALYGILAGLDEYGDVDYDSIAEDILEWIEENPKKFADAMGWSHKSLTHTNGVGTTFDYVNIKTHMVARPR